MAGQRAGLAGERSGLWFEFHRILRECQPRWAVIENVPGLLSSNGGRDFAVILRGLEDIGYHAAWRVLDAQYIGLAQRRKRVFVVASLGSYRCVKVLFESKGLSRNPAEGREAGSCTPTLPASGAGTSRTGNERTEAEMMVVGPLDTGGASGNNAHGGAWPGTTVQGDIEGNLVADCLDTHLGDKRWLEDQSIHKYDIMRRAGAGVRRLTPTECERLQGFDDGWTAMHSDTARYRQLGNAVAVPVAEWIGRRIVAND